MTLRYEPGVRIVFGYAGRAAMPPPTYASAPTLALQKAVTQLGKDWKQVAPMFVVAPAAGSGRVAVGLGMGRVPVLFDTPQRVEPKSALSKEHLVVPSGFSTPPDVDRYGNTQADRGILEGLAAGAADPAITGLGLTLEDVDRGPAYFLVSDDGRAGAFVYGQVLWKLGASYEGGAVRTFTRDYGGGEGVRLVGAPYAEVGPDQPITRIDDSPASREQHGRTSTAAVRALLDTPAAWSWFLVCDVGPGPFTVAATPVASAKPRAKAASRSKKKAPALGTTFTVRPLSACVAALEALGDGALVPQPLDAPEIATAYFHEDPSGSAAGPRGALYALRAAPPAAVLADPARLLRSSAVPPDALGAWNANAKGRWASGEGWAVLDVELVSEQEDDAFDTRVAAIVALFAVEEGWASLVWPAGRLEQLAGVLGFDPWTRDEWRECSFWFGE